jgi:hypothetical protein
VYRSVWTDDDAARRFFELYEKVLKGKWRSMNVEERTPSRLAGRGDDGYFCVELSATTVTSWEGLAEGCAR